MHDQGEELCDGDDREGQVLFHTSSIGLTITAAGESLGKGIVTNDTFHSFAITALVALDETGVRSAGITSNDDDVCSETLFPIVNPPGCLEEGGSGIGHQSELIRAHIAFLRSVFIVGFQRRCVSMDARLADLLGDRVHGSDSIFNLVAASGQAESQDNQHDTNPNSILHNDFHLFRDADVRILYSNQTKSVMAKEIL